MNCLIWNCQGAASKEFRLTGWIRKQVVEADSAFSLSYPLLGVWMKMKIDGCWKAPAASAGAGGLIRDCRGNWIYGFTMNTGSCRGVEAELCMAWNLGYRNVILVVDLVVVVHMLSMRPHFPHYSSNLLYRCRMGSLDRERVIEHSELPGLEWSL